jgi:ligand-binding sensor domain-containing protein
VKSVRLLRGDAAQLRLAILVVLAVVLPVRGRGADAPITSPPRVLRVLPENDRLWLATTSGLLELDADDRLTKEWHQADGLPSDVIYDVAKDSNGAMWVATSNGPARRAGARFEPVTSGLPVSATTVLLPTRGGDLYIGTLRGIARFDHERWVAVPDTHEFGRDRVVSAVEGPNGSLWFAKERAITRLLPDGTTQVMYRDPLDPDRALALDSTRAQAMTFDVVGRLWVATDQGVSVLDGDRVVTHERWRPGLWGVGGLPGTPVWSIWIDASDFVWLTFGDGPVRGFVARRRRTAGEWERVAIGDPNVPVSIYALASDAAGTIWAGTSRGLYRRDHDRFDAWPLRAVAPIGDGRK